MRTARAALVILLSSFLVMGCGDEPMAPVPEEAKPLYLPLELRIVASWPSEVAGLSSIAVNADGRIYLGGEQGVHIVDRDGTDLAMLEVAGPVTCLQVDADGLLYVGSRARVRVFDAQGGLLREWGRRGDAPGELSYVTSIAAAGPNVFVADSGNRIVHRFDTTGDYIGAIGGPDAERGTPGFLCPGPHLDVAIDAEGNLVASNPGLLRVEVHSLRGEMIDRWGDPGMRPEFFCGCCNPTDLALTADGQVVTSEKGKPRVKLHTPDGRVLAHLGGDTFSPNADGIDVAVGPDGLIYTADPGDGMIRILEAIEQTPGQNGTEDESG